VYEGKRTEGEGCCLRFRRAILSTDVALLSFQKLRGGATHLADLFPFSEDEDAQDPTQDGLIADGESMLARLNASTDTNDGESTDVEFFLIKLRGY
jgi:hypothetical protein